MITGVSVSDTFHPPVPGVIRAKVSSVHNFELFAVLFN